MKLLIAYLFSYLLCNYIIAQNAASFKDSNLSVEERIADLLKQLTLEEKISLLGYQSKAVPRLGIRKIFISIR
jgi:beta-glucosidase